VNPLGVHFAHIAFRISCSSITPAKSSKAITRQSRAFAFIPHCIKRGLMSSRAHSHSIHGKAWSALGRCWIH